MYRSMPRLRSSLLALLIVGLISSASLAVDKSPATIKLTVPADAVVEVDGVKKKQTGVQRTFVTPDLENGKKFTYELKITYKVDGKPVVVDKTVIVEAGKEVIVDLGKDVVETAKSEEKIGEPKPVVVMKEEPKPVEVKKEEPKTTVAKFEFEEPKKQIRLDVPYVPTPEPVVEAMLKLANVTDKDVVYDLGCGDGRIVITAVKKFKAKSGMGIELFPERVKLSKENAKKEGVEGKVEIREGSVLDMKDVSDASVVTLYLLPDINLKLMPMLKKTLKPGSRIVSHDFDMGDWKAEKEISVKDETGREHTIYLWTIGEEPKKAEPKVEFKKDTPKVEIEIKLPKVEVKIDPIKVQPKVEVKGEQIKVEPRVEAKKENPTTSTTVYSPTPPKVVDAMLKLADIKKTDTVYDLGSGDGRIGIAAVSKYGARNGWGVDLNPDRVKESNANAKKAGIDNRLFFAQGDAIKLKDASEAQVVTLCLKPEVSSKLAPVLQKTLKPGARVVSHNADINDWKYDKKIEVTDEGVVHSLYLWVIK